MGTVLFGLYEMICRSPREFAETGLLGLRRTRSSSACVHARRPLGEPVVFRAELGVRRIEWRRKLAPHARVRFSERVGDDIGCTRPAGRVSRRHGHHPLYESRLSCRIATMVQRIRKIKQSTVTCGRARVRAASGQYFGTF